MKQTHLPIFFLFFAFLLSSCLKEKLDPESLSGSWKYEAARFTGNKADSLVPLEGVFTFQKSTGTYNAGGTVYGDFCMGSGDFPGLNEKNPGSKAFTYKQDMNLTKAHEPDNYNYRNFYTGVYGFLYQGTNYYAPIRISMVSKNEIVIRLERSQNSDFRFNVVSMKLKRM